MDDDIGLVRPYSRDYTSPIFNAPLYEVNTVSDRLEPPSRPRARFSHVEVDDRVAPLSQPTQDVATNKTGTTCDENRASYR